MACERTTAMSDERTRSIQPLLQRAGRRTPVSRSEFIAIWTALVGEPPAIMLDNHSEMIRLLIDSSPVAQLVNVNAFAPDGRSVTVRAIDDAELSGQSGQRTQKMNTAKAESPRICQQLFGLTHSEGLCLDMDMAAVEPRSEVGFRSVQVDGQE